MENRNLKKISLCMIVKNEEATLLRCLESARGLVDEIIIVDTGSTDSTKKIAEGFGARIYDFAWDNNFSNARNFSLSKAEGEWVLVLDGDEFLSQADHVKIRTAVEDSDYRYYTLLQTNYLSQSSHIHFRFNDLTDDAAQGYMGYVEIPLVRLFRNAPEIRFSGIIHENIAIQGDAHALGALAVRIHHDGFYKKDGAVEKNNLYLNLAREKCSDEPLNWHHHYELGNQLWKLGSNEAALLAYEEAYKLNDNSVEVILSLASLCYQAKNYRRAVKLFLDIIRLDSTNSHIYTTFPVILYEAGFKEEAINICEQGYETLKGNPLYHFNRALLLQNMGRYEEALNHYQSTLYKKYRIEEVYLQSGMCHLKMGHYQESLACFDRVTAENHKKEILKSTAICHLTFGNLDQGIGFLNQAFLLESDDPEICYFLGLAYFESGNQKGAFHYLSQCADDARLTDTIRNHCKDFISVIQTRLGGVYE